LAAGCCQPISDKRASADYRRDLVEVLTRRSIREAASSCLNL
jgi:CO/xanthine dehydrogenase FAD-binding subunit